MDAVAGKGSIVTIIARSKRVSTMMSRFRDMVRRLGDTENDGADAWHDPLSHPAIRSMSSRELADLPFSAGYGKRPVR